MKTFTYENVGSEVMLVYELGKEEHVNGVAKGMLQSNEMEGVVSPSFLQRDDCQFFKYPITSKIPLKDYLAEEVKQTAVLQLLISIVKTVKEAEEYLLCKERFLFNTEYMFADITKNQVFLIYLPVDEYHVNVSFKELCLRLLGSMRFDMDEDVSYVAKIITGINKMRTEDLDEFLKLFHRLEEERIRRPAPSFSNSPAIDGQTDGPGCPVENEWKKPELQNLLPPQIPSEPPQTPSKKILFGKKEKEIKEKKKEKRKDSSDFVPQIAIPGREMQKPQQGEIIMDFNPETGRMAPPDIPTVSDASHKKEKIPLFAFGKKKGKAMNPEPVRMPTPLPPVGQVSYAAQDQNASLTPSEFPGQNVPAAQNSLINSAGGSSDYENHTIIFGGGKDYSSTILLGSETADKGTVFPCARITRQRTGQSMEIHKDVFHLGSASNYTDFYIGDNPAVTAAHADIFLNEGNYYISDRNSLNHTFVNGRMLAAGENVRLENGDIVLLANEAFEFMLG